MVISVTSKTVTMCVCHNKSFEELKAYAIRYNLLEVEELIERKLCCRGCGMCYPYICKMIRTGETAFAPGDVY